MKWPHSRRDYMKAVIIAILFVGSLAFANYVRDFGIEQRKQASFTAASRESRLVFQAKQTFILCSRDPAKTVIVDRAEDVKKACIGYESLTAAIATERAKQAAALDNPSCDGVLIPIPRGDPGYSVKLDRDRDGMACE